MQLEQVDFMTIQEQVRAAFEAQYGTAPIATVRAPGCVTLIGGHTEYNGGYVLPMNINRHTVAALQARDDSVVAVYSQAYDETVTFDLNGFQRDGDTWAEYIKAVAWALSEEGYALRGWEGIVGSNIPMGIGLGASAALLMTVIGAFASVSGFAFDKNEMAQIAYKAETEWLGRDVGIGDLLSVAVGNAKEALLVDEQSGTFEQVAFPIEANAVILPTGVLPDRAATEAIVKTRIEENQAAVSAYKVSHLRDLSMSRFEKDADEIEDDIFSRAKHIMTENGRTILAGEMLRSDAVSTVGRLMNDSHTSLQDNYGLVSDEANQMFNCIMEQPNVLGARASGYAVGGLVVALVRDLSADTAMKLAVGCYKKATGKEVDAFVADASAGVEIIQ